MTHVNSLMRSEIEAFKLFPSVKIIERLDKITRTKPLLKWDVDICTGCHDSRFIYLYLILWHVYGYTVENLY